MVDPWIAGEPLARRLALGAHAVVIADSAAVTPEKPPEIGGGTRSWHLCRRPRAPIWSDRAPLRGRRAMIAGIPPVSGERLDHAHIPRDSLEQQDCPRHVGAAAPCHEIRPVAVLQSYSMRRTSAMSSVLIGSCIIFTRFAVLGWSDAARGGASSTRRGLARRYLGLRSVWPLLPALGNPAGGPPDHGRSRGAACSL
jgi:hypothetical protein